MRNNALVKLLLVGIVVFVTTFSAFVYSHCQIPCGIYDDKMRFDMIAENLTTIEKSAKQIVELSKAEKPEMNQIVRWVNNKEKHADDTSHIISYYFLTQRITPADKSNAAAYEKYANKLALLHQMLVYTMKTKQSTDLTNIEKLRGLLSEFQTAYFAETSHK